MNYTYHIINTSNNKMAAKALSLRVARQMVRALERVNNNNYKIVIV